MELSQDFKSLVWSDLNPESSKEPSKKTNVNGSAIATGHPNTASGARLIMNLMYALGAICGGLAQADACVIKV